MLKNILFYIRIKISHYIDVEYEMKIMRTKF